VRTYIVFEEEFLFDGFLHKEAAQVPCWFVVPFSLALVFWYRLLSLTADSG
jgi:hypothetical protein